jgi:hypothetical protein
VAGANSAAFGDVAVDTTTHNVWALWDDGNLNIASSPDHGQSFGAITTPPGAATYSDWSVGGASIFDLGAQALSGEPAALYVVPMASVGWSASVTGVATLTAGQGAVSADETGNAYLAIGSGTAVSLSRVLAGASAATSTRHIAAGIYPGVVAGPNNSAVVVYTGANGTSVYVTVQAY